MCELNSICRSSCRSKGSTKAEYKSPPIELSPFVSRCLKSSSNQDSSTSDKNTDPSPVTICKETTEGKGSDLAKIVDDEDQASTRPCATETKAVLVGSHRVDTSH
jgi:hypothetical protein